MVKRIGEPEAEPICKTDLIEPDSEPETREEFLVLDLNRPVDFELVCAVDFKDTFNGETIWDFGNQEKALIRQIKGRYHKLIYLGFCYFYY